MNRPGDWNCRSCSHLNFQRRDSCQRCGDPRPGDIIRSSILDPYGGFSSRGGLSSVGGGGGGGGGGTGTLFGFTTGPDVRAGDWYCAISNCGAHNFASRSSCFKCGVSKDGNDAFSGGFDADLLRSRGFRLGAGGGGSSSSGGGVGRSGWKSGDWICTRLGCNEHNFASRMECFRCNAPRDLSGSSYSS